MIKKHILIPEDFDGRTGPVFIISDLHLMNRPEAYLFDHAKEKAFVRLAHHVRAENGTLVLAGDIFDLTGMTPCRVGVEDFFGEAVDPSRLDLSVVAQSVRIRGTEELLIEIRKVFTEFFALLATLAEEGRLIYIPGNHDCAFLQTEGKLILARVIGSEKILWRETLRIFPKLAVNHGNEFDRDNSTALGCQNPGFVFTSALYLGVLPALAMYGLSPNILHAILAVRPDEETIGGLEHYLGEEACRKLLIAFARLLQRNGYFRGASRWPAWLLTHDVPWLSRTVRARVTPARMRAMLPDETWLREGAERSAALFACTQSWLEKIPNGLLPSWSSAIPTSLICTLTTSISGHGLIT